MGNEYKTKDLSEAAALVVNSQKLLRIERSGNICFFVFSNKEECVSLSSDFLFGELKVNAREFSECLGRLKNMIFR